MTFADLVGRILLAAGLPHRPLSDIGRRAVLAGILAELAAAKQLATLSRLLDVPGLVVAVDRAIRELKRARGRAAVSPAWANAANPGTPRCSRCLAGTRRTCSSTSSTTTSTATPWRTEQLRPAGCAVPLAPARLVADGFTEFSHGQLQILQWLSQRAEHLVITLPLAAMAARNYGAGAAASWDG